MLAFIKFFSNSFIVRVGVIFEAINSNIKTWHTILI